MNILLACDKFKGTASSIEVGEALASALSLGHSVELLEVSDGGDGFLSCISQMIPLDFFDWEGKSQGFHFSAQYGVDSVTQTVFIESAQVLGNPLLHQIPLSERHSGPLGDLIKHSIKTHFPQRIFIGLGGTLTSDGGMGCLSVLGARFLDKRGHDLVPSALALKDIHSAQVSLDLPPITAIYDVLNPPVGPQGGVMTYGFQKGGRLAELEQIEEGMRSWAHLYGLQNLTGGGAAGGLGLGLSIGCHASLEHGAKWIFGILNMSEKISKADLIVTGEGDYNPLHQGKIPQLLMESGTPSILVTGLPFDGPGLPMQCRSHYSLLPHRLAPVLSPQATILALEKISESISCFLEPF